MGCPRSWVLIFLCVPRVPSSTTPRRYPRRRKRGVSAVSPTCVTHFITATVGAASGTRGHCCQLGPRLCCSAYLPSQLTRIKRLPQIPSLVNNLEAEEGGVRGEGVILAISQDSLSGGARVPPTDDGYCCLGSAQSVNSRPPPEAGLGWGWAGLGWAS